MPVGIPSGLKRGPLSQGKSGEVLETRRWWVLLSFSIHLCVTIMCWFTYSPLTTITKLSFSASDHSFLFLTNSYLFAFLLCFASGAWLALKSLQKTLLGCMFLAALGAWIRFFADNNFLFTLFGQFMLGVSCSPLFAFVTVIIQEWFSERERLTVKAISLFSVYFGCALGYFIPGVIVSDNPETISFIEFFECIVASVSLILGFFCIRDKPEVAPSLSALMRTPKFPNLKEEIKFLLSIPNVIFSTFIFGICLGLSYAFPLTMDLLLQIDQISSGHQCALGVIYIAGGFLARIIGVIWIKRSGNPNYDTVLKALLTCSVSSLFCLGIFMHLFEIRSLPILYIFYLLLGAGLVGFIPFACNSFAQSTFPVQELISINLLLGVGALFGIIVTHLSIAKFVEAGGVFLLAGMASPCWVYIMFYYKTDYRKLRAKNISLELDLEFGKLNNQDKRGFPLVSPIEKKSSLHFVPYHQLSQFSKDLISSNPQTPLLRKEDDGIEAKIIRSHSNNVHDRKKTNSHGAKLEELVDMTHFNH